MEKYNHYFVLHNVRSSFTAQVQNSERNLFILFAERMQAEKESILVKLIFILISW